MRKSLPALLIAGSLVLSTSVMARDVNIKVTNLTNGITFTPLLFAFHGKGHHLFEAGTTASFNLQKMAEGGNISGLVTDVNDNGGEVIANPAGGLLGPGDSAEGTMDVNRKMTYLSIVAMLLPTNDGFAGLDSLRIPKASGHYTYYMNGYDAGTEVNDEIVNGGGAPGVPGIPMDPEGNASTGGSGVTEEENNAKIHIHRGIIGDMLDSGGISDLDPRVHRWLNPVAKVEIIVNKKNRRHGR